MATKLVKRGGTYSVRYVVPSKMRSIVGYQQKWKSTGTGDKREAERRARSILTQLERRVEAEYLLKAGAASNTKASTNWMFEVSRDLTAQLESGEITVDDAKELYQVHLEQHLKARGISLDAELDEVGRLPEGMDPDHVRQLRRAAKFAAASDAAGKPLDDAIEKYLDVRTGNVAMSTLKRIQGVLEDFNQWAGHPAVSDVSRELVGRYVADVIVPKELAYKTKAWHVSALRKAWRYFMSRDWTPSTLNPWDGHLENYRESSRGDASKVTNRRPYTPDELQTLRTKLAPDDALYQAAVLCLHTGARVEEIAGMKVGDVKLSEGFMAVPVGKNRNSMRQLATHRAITPVLESLTANRDPDEYLFSSLSGGGYDGKLSKSLTNRGWRFKAAHFDNDPRLVFFHSLRNTFTTALEQAGVDPLMIQRLTGHTPQQITFSVYSAGPQLAAMREAVDRIDFGF